MVGNEEKMYRIAEHLNDLNGAGRVKGVRSNQKGYATVKRIVKGCAVIVNRSNEDVISVDLFVSPKALVRDEIICNKAIALFNKLFDPMVQVGSWISLRGKPRNPDIDYHRYFVEKPCDNLQEMLDLVDSLMVKFDSLR